MNICTIIAKNYLAHARVLAESFREHHPDGTFTTLVIDEVEGYIDPDGEVFEIGDVLWAYVWAYVLALHKGRPGEAYNVGSSQGTSVRELFELVRREAGIEVRLEVEPSRMRATDIPCLVADTQKTSMELGWEPEVLLEKTIRDMLDAASRIPAGYSEE